ncbi:MAG TPA: ABC transporter ATP-binding protein [Chthoniobacterales bacterium]|nr:ABC transporter ATP-binding protein [Chthoniobacterales bacterium]
MSESQRTGIFIDRLSHSFDDYLVLDEITCSFPSGTLVAVLGPSGCGKTTFLKAAAGLIHPTAGVVTLDGIHPSIARRQGSVGFAFQSPTLLPWRTTLENVLLPLELFKNSNTPKRRHHATDLLSIVDLNGDSDKLPRQLSGGMQQRVGLVRALVTEPSFLFLDEPFGALDGITRDKLNQKVRELWQKFDLTILFVTHSIEEAIFLAEEIIILGSRPAKIRKIVHIELGENRDALTRLNSQFFEYQKSIRRLIEEMK